MGRRAGLLARLIIPLAMTVLAPAAAGAQSAYTADDILAHFAAPGAPSGPAKPPPRTRSLCVGTASECNAPAAAGPSTASVAEAKPIPGFDLRVNFNYNSETLTPPARSNLDEFAKALRDPRLSNSRFLVEGHTDGAGSDAFNLDLSRRRARSVVRYLTARGVGPARLEAVGLGKQRPVVPDPMSSENRRVEARLRDQ